MKNILLNACGLFCIILAGFFTKKIGLLKKEDGKTLSTIIVNITLPAAIILGLADIKMSSMFLLLMCIAFFLNFILVVIGGILWKDKAKTEKTLFMYCLSGYNIGNFSLPFIQSFFPVAIPFLFMFDVGNCIMIAGGSSMIVEKMVQKKKKVFSFQSISKNLLHSVPFLTYLVMLMFKIFQLPIPSFTLPIFKLFASTNGFLSLFMIGLYLELNLPKNELQTASKLLLWRYFFATVSAGFFYYVLPVPKIVKIVLVLIAFSPIPTFAVINSVNAGVKESITGFVSSVSIIISLILMTIIMLIFI